MISIIIPIYNQADKLGKCLDSILAQAYKDFEIIVVDDGSTDNFNEIINKYKNNLKIINQENKGAPSARNRGVKEVKGEYILFCDADIVMKPEMLSEMLNALKNNPDKSYAYSSFFWGRKLFKLEKFSAEKLKNMPYIHTTSLIRKEHFSTQGGQALQWDENIKKLQDWDLWLAMLKNGRTGVFINKVLFKVQTGGTMSNWLPSIFYKIFPFLLSVRKYKEAVKVIKNKHHLSFRA
ncbi:MAG: glycosyltransferase family A protein [Candidatus Falkowbacteria bacterium]